MFVDTLTDPLQWDQFFVDRYTMYNQGAGRKSMQQVEIYRSQDIIHKITTLRKLNKRLRGGSIIVFYQSTWFRQRLYTD
ncbi:hypothetical protein DESHY_110141 [Desulforamulus hydrothermalis Lam5 = DSM 18033]|uniref:Uncharacterized protein n=1 Tax=Desulforamulus hydrothermalis Lam5 = DSM 18033 TaxID=1121428 RepID=K8DX93_9FIRM|nr:hypothetical protein DESHY_110141 [Desulforamulus hydrothermalis Lam5 = DSM 18033]